MGVVSSSSPLILPVFPPSSPRLLRCKGTSAWNALVVGEKRWVLFHPDTPAHLLNADKTLDMEKTETGEMRDGEMGCGEIGEGNHRRTVVEEEGEGGNEGRDDGQCMSSGLCWEDVWGWFHEDLETIKQRVRDHFGGRSGGSSGGRRGGRSGDSRGSSGGGGDWSDVGDGGDGDDGESGGSGGSEWWIHEFVQKPGDIVFVPSQWHHAVLNLSDTVAVTHNYCSRSNLSLCYDLMEDRVRRSRRKRRRKRESHSTSRVVVI